MGTIKSFKKFIEESIWSDIQDRSMGKTVRKEDEYDIDEKELERSVDTCIRTYVIGFIYYDKYDGSSDTFLKYIQEWNRNICQNAQLYDRRFGKYVEPIKVIPSYVKKNWETGKSYKSLVDKKMSEEEKKVKDTGFIKKPGESISDTLSKWFDENFEKLGDDFCEEIEEYNERYHNEGGSMSVDLGVEDWWDNLEYIEQVEIYQDYMKKTNESIWSDIQDRSMGKTVRKEDDINLLDKDGLYEYLISHYKPLENIDIKSCISCGKSHISLCVFIYPKQTVYSILLDILNCRVKVRTPYIKRWPTNLLDMIDKKYYREDVIDSNRDHMTFITPKEGKGNNQFYIDFLDMILNNVDKPFLKKVINESIWSDIQDRSMGKTVRKEDERHIYLERLLATYIKLFAESCHYHDEYTYCSYPDFRSYIKDFRDNPRIEEVCPNDSYFDDLLDYVNKETWDNQIFDTVVEISQRIVHGEHPITDDVIKELRKHNVNESIWSDIQDRSMGKTVRKEDDVNLFDYDGLYDYIKSKYSGKLFYIDKDYFGQGGETICVDPIENVSLFLKRLKDGSLEHILLSWASVDIDDSFLLKLEERFFVSSPNVKRRIIKEKDGTCTNQTYIDVIDFFLEHIDNIVVNESIWSDIQDRSMGKTVRKEDEMTSDDYKNLKEVLKMFGREVGFFGVNKNQKFFPVNAKTYKITLEDCLYFIDVLANGKFTGADFSKLKKYIEVNWEQDPMIKNIIQWTVDGENDKGIDRKIRNSVKREKTWDLYECDGVPGGLTPADVGGMGPAYFPGPNGEPGSGDLPSPTGIVYKQVAPYTMFIKDIKKKKKKKKFRKEDELCVHSENPPIYSHVDDFRDYVDRTYNNIDKRK